jgi:hypothetical protein
MPASCTARPAGSVRLLIRRPRDHCSCASLFNVSWGLGEVQPQKHGGVVVSRAERLGSRPQISAQLFGRWSHARSQFRPPSWLPPPRGDITTIGGHADYRAFGYDITHISASADEASELWYRIIMCSAYDENFWETESTSLTAERLLH